MFHTCSERVGTIFAQGVASFSFEEVEFPEGAEAFSERGGTLYPDFFGWGCAGVSQVKEASYEVNCEGNSGFRDISSRENGVFSSRNWDKISWKVVAAIYSTYRNEAVFH
jgi:hypothetical protein